MEIHIQNQAQLFMHIKYIVFSSLKTLALQSVDRTFVQELQFCLYIKSSQDALATNPADN
jgi:hypothetical protein